MATYLYKCDDCAHDETSVFPMGTAPSAVECAKCGGEARRKFTPPATVIK